MKLNRPIIVDKLSAETGSGRQSVEGARIIIAQRAIGPGTCFKIASPKDVRPLSCKDLVSKSEALEYCRGKK